MQTLGIPYPKGSDENAENVLIEQALKITVNLQESGIAISHEKEIIALIAYLQRLGTDIKVKETGE
jgi:cytochrome c oxidase cbb3-type subunit I/II